MPAEPRLLRAYGRTVAAPPEVAALLPPHWPDAPPGSRPDRVADDAPPETAARALEHWVAEHARGVVFVHAGVVAVDGRALLLPGRSHAGKSTLTAALVRGGAAYLSDEYAVLRPDGRVQAYPRDLALRPRAGEGGAPTRLPAGSLGPVPRGALPVALVALLRYAGDPRGWHVAPLTPGDVALGLIDNAVAARRRPHAVLRAASAVARTAAGIGGNRGDADAAAAVLVGILGQARPTGR